MAPRISTLCTAILQDSGVYGQLEIEAFPLELIPLEKDVLSLEVPESYKAIFSVSQVPTRLYVTQNRAGWRFYVHLRFGESSYDSAKGFWLHTPNSGQGRRSTGIVYFQLLVKLSDQLQRLVSLLQRLHKEQPETSAPSRGPIDSLIILDRQIDLVTPLCTQLTYEGLIDELLGIKNGNFLIQVGGLP